jgi:hypothetical protein
MMPGQLEEECSGAEVQKWSNRGIFEEIGFAGRKFSCDLPLRRNFGTPNSYQKRYNGTY